METPLRGRSGGHTGTAPTHFVWEDCVWNGWFRLGRLRVDGWWRLSGLRMSVE